MVMQVIGVVYGVRRTKMNDIKIQEVNVSCDHLENIITYGGGICGFGCSAGGICGLGCD